MTTLYLSPAGVLLQLFNNIGGVLSLGKIFTYVGGSVNTPVVTYTDATGTTQNANPILCNSAGRPASGAAQVSIWVPANTPHKIVIQDSAGNQLASLDNLYGINDPTFVLSSVSVDLLANAVRSYDIFATLRASAQPALNSGDTKIVILEGGAAIGDGLGGAFYWDATSALADNAATVIKLTATTGNGRYRRIAWNASNGVDAALGTQQLGWLNTPQNIQNNDYGLVLADSAKQLYHSSATPHTFTIPANASVAYPVGTLIDVVNDNGAGNLTIAITTDTLRWIPSGSTGSRTLAPNGAATLKKITTTVWQITGINLT